MIDPEKRLAAALSGWARAEISTGFRQFRSVTSRVGAVEHEEVMRGPFETMERAARALTGHIRGAAQTAGFEPRTHVLVWRVPPELVLRGDYDRQAYAYARFSFVPIGETGDCEEIAP